MNLLTPAYLLNIYLLCVLVAPGTVTQFCSLNLLIYSMWCVLAFAAGPQLVAIPWEQ